MKIEKFKKVGIDKYKVFGEDTEFVLYEDVILKYNLLRKDTININELESILEENKVYEIYDVALKYLGIKLRSKSEIESYLLKKGYEINSIGEIIEKLETNGLLNDTVYIEAFINDSINLKNDGPYKIKQNLINLGFEDALIDKHLNKINESVWEEKVKNLINKQIKKNTKYSFSMLKQRIMNDLYLKGYDKEMISSLLNNVESDDSGNLEKEYKKASAKYSKKYNEKELIQKIIVYLQSRGYNYSKIKDFIDNKNN